MTKGKKTGKKPAIKTEELYAIVEDLQNELNPYLRGLIVEGVIREVLKRHFETA